jgi:drug/metabolite transporter (DMT)-like permease
MVVSLFVAMTAAVSDPNVFAGLSVAGMLIAAAVLARPRGRVEPPAARRRIRAVALGLGAAAALTGSASVASITLGSPATIAAAVFAAAGTWVVLLRGLLYWSQRPRAARSGTDAVGVEARAA